MDKKVVEIRQNKIVLEHRKRVAAYARVSSPKDSMLHSLAAQIDYYRQLILGNPAWEFAGVYADEGRTGTKEDREQFQALLEKCRSGGVDMVITKSISRLARNTVTLLETVRELKSYGVDVFFEEQNIHTLSTDGEVLLTLLASFAQAESLDVSENCKWRIRNKFKEGRASTCTMLGYRLVDGEITIVPEEAEIVRRIFEMYLAGDGLTKISNTLNAEGLRTVYGKPWHTSAVARVLDNEKYGGDLTLQRFFSSDHISKRKMVNTGELPRYQIEDDHEAIIEKPEATHKDKEKDLTTAKEKLKQAQKELDELKSSAEQMEKLLKKAERERRAVNAGRRSPTSALTGRIRCPYCGKNYRRKSTTGGVKWCCSTFNTQGKEACPDSKMIPEETLLSAICSVMGTAVFNEAAFKKRVGHIDACRDNVLRFCFSDGAVEEFKWKDRSRAESWTPEMRQAAGEHAKRRWKHGG